MNFLSQLTQQATAALQQHSAAPQRYGTAFHLTPPVTDVRQLNIARRDHAPDVTAWQHLTAADRRRLTAFDPTDVYFAWQLAHLDQVYCRLIHLPANTAADLTINSAGIYWIVLEPGSALKLADVISSPPISLHRLFIWQKAGSRCDFWGLRTSNNFLNEKVQVELLEPDAQATVTHLTLSRHHEQIDLAVNVYHRAPRTTSHLQTRHAATGTSVTIYRGLIDIAQTARGSTGQQASRVLLLSPTAVADTLPSLQIHTNDVQAGHGVTTTHLDPTALHYMRSRGLPEPSARQLAIAGFFHHQLSIPAAIATRLNQAVEIT